MTQNFLHWLGGFFDGEGTCGTYWESFWAPSRNKLKQYHYKRKTLHAAISQKDKMILQQIRKEVGFGCVSKVGLTGHSWSCSYAQARKFLNSIQPFLRTKHKKAQVKTALQKDAKKEPLVKLGERIIGDIKT